MLSNIVLVSTRFSQKPDKVIIESCGIKNHKMKISYQNIVPSDGWECKYQTYFTIEKWQKPDEITGIIKEWLEKGYNII